VLIVLMNAWGMGGTIRTVHNLAGHLAKSHDVEIVSVFRRRKKPFFEFPAGVEVSALDDRRPGEAPPRFRFLQRSLRACPSVLMHPADAASGECNLLVDLLLARKLRRQSGFLIGTRPGLNLIMAELSPPGLITIGQEHMHLRAHPLPLRWAIKRRYPKLGSLAVLTEADVREYEALLGGRARQLRPVRLPNAVGDLGGEAANLGSAMVLAAGRLTPQKGFDLLVRAFTRVSQAHPDWRLRICGDGRQREILERLVGERELTGIVELPGRRDLAEEIAQASIFVLSSRFEGFPLVLLEAMSRGMAVVSFDCPTGPSDVIDDRRNGILVPAGDVGGLANGIVELIEDEELRRRCSAAAIETARAFTIEAIGARWEGLLAELGKSQGGRADSTASAAEARR
jgi:glycosyltransferase involved in cell wall biosynthesis